MLRRMQPESGGYLEATPLTSFVVMSLASIGQVTDEATVAGVQFLDDSMRENGSWPIDTNLATWNTSLALKALDSGGEDLSQLDCLDWLLKCQHQRRHPFTGASPGGWGWSDLSGAVPDCDDTPAALLAIDAWRRGAGCDDTCRLRIDKSAAAGLEWALSLQNRDGGWPTFCRGWGRLPFDRSGRAACNSSLVGRPGPAGTQARSLPGRSQPGFLLPSKTATGRWQLAPSLVWKPGQSGR